MKDNARICIEISPGIGDLIMLTPALRSIKNQYPNTKITVLSSSENSLKAIKRLPYIENDITLEMVVTELKKCL